MITSHATGLVPPSPVNTRVDGPRDTDGSHGTTPGTELETLPGSIPLICHTVAYSAGGDRTGGVSGGIWAPHLTQTVH